MARYANFGDDSLWHLAIENYYPRIVNYVYYLTGDRYLAEDIAQETFAKAIDKFYQLKDPNKFFPWLVTIALNISRSQIKSNRWANTSSDIDSVIPLLAADEYPVAIVERKERQKLVQNSIAKLSPREKQVIIMRYYLELKDKEIAFALGVTVGTVKKELFRARAKLYHDLHQLSEREGDYIDK